MNGTLEAMARAIFKDWFVDFGPTRAKAEGRTPYLAPDIWDLFPDALDDEDKPVKTMGDIQTFAVTSEEDLTPDAIQQFRVPLIPAGTVLVSFKLTVGRVALAAKDMHSNEAIAHLVANHETPVANVFTYCFMKDFNYESLGSTSSIATAVNSKVDQGD